MISFLGVNWQKLKKVVFRYLYEIPDTQGESVKFVYLGQKENYCKK